MTRYVTDSAEMAEVRESLNKAFADLNPTPPSVEMEDDTPYRLYRLCPCEECEGTGKLDREQAIAYGEKVGRTVTKHFDSSVTIGCPACRREGRTLALLATATDPQSVGVALVTLAEEDEWDECPFGLMYRPEGQTGKWLIKPWGPSPRNISDAGRTLRSARTA